MPFVTCLVSRSRLLATGFHTCKYIESLYSPSAGCAGKMPSIVNLFRVVQSDQQKAALQIPMTLLVCPESVSINLYRSAKQKGFLAHCSSSLVALHMNLARGQVKKMWSVSSYSPHKAHRAEDGPRRLAMLSLDGSRILISCHRNTRILRGIAIPQISA